jgi:glc operon protein GlcG
LVLLFGNLPAVAQTHAGNNKIPVGTGTKRGTDAAVFGGRSANAANSFGAVTAAASSSSAVTYFDSEKVAAAFAKGGTLFDGVAAGKNYQVITSRRDKPGLVEIHTLDTDVVYVLEGTATYVTGGTVVDSKTTAPDELRGTSIEGGETRQLSKGDVVIVPNGVPHWFKEVRAPFLYFVVKVR